MITNAIRAVAIGTSLTLPLTHGAIANIPVDLELSLVTDVSGSVVLSEYQLMMDGYENAFRSPSLINAIESGTRGAIAVNLVFFDDSAIEGLPFTLITNASEANAFADDILALRSAKPSSGGTSIASGINLAVSLFDLNTFDGTRQVIDVAGDGTGSSPGNARDAAVAAGVDTINGIVIGSDPSGTLAQFYEDEVIAGADAFVAVAPTFADFQPEIQAKIEREIRGTPTTIADTARLISSNLRSTSISTTRTMTQAVNDRMFSMRAGVRAEPSVSAPPTPSSAKSGSKGGISKAPIITTQTCPWEVWGKVFWFTQDQDAQYLPVAIPGANIRTLTTAETTIDIFGGAAGVEYDLNSEWSLGFAISAARAESDLTLVGNTEVDSVALMPYISYYKSLTGTIDVYADLLYGYGTNDYETQRFPGPVAGSPEGNSHTLEFNTGLNFKQGRFVHGPIAQVRYLDGEIDGYTEFGPLGLTYPEADYESFATQLGYQASYYIPAAGGLVVPQARAAWEHEFEEDLGTFAGLPQGTLDEDLAILGIGVGYFMNCGWNLILDYETRLGSETSSHYVGLKAGIDF